ncbi:MAG TPA: hypothetical protein VIV40_13945 [Kofleriaceae bacterium]
MKALALLLLVGCASSFQSARTLAPGKTQVTAGLARVMPTEGSGHANVGDVQVRTGISDSVDGGLKLSRTPGAANTVSGIGADLKLRITDPAAKTTVSFALPVGAVWEERGTDWGNGLLTISPTILIGVELSPTTELVLGPALVWVLPDGGTDNSEAEFAATIGVRFTDPSRTWAVHPEIGIMHISDSGNSENLLSFGLGVAVGN